VEASTSPIKVNSARSSQCFGSSRTMVNLESLNGSPCADRFKLAEITLTVPVMLVDKESVGRSAATREEAVRRARMVGELRAQNKTFEEIGQTLGISAKRARQLYLRSGSLDQDLYLGKPIPPSLKQAMYWGEFQSPGEVRAAILDGRFKVTGKPKAQTTVQRIGLAKFSEICAFLSIDERALPPSVPVAVRMAGLINEGTTIDVALEEIIGNSTHLRKVAKIIARITTNLSPAALKRFQDWGSATD